MQEAKYDAEKLRSMLDKGHAMKNSDGDPSYPIADEEDLRKAIHAVGRGGADHGAIRAHITKRAKALGKTDMIPEDWKGAESATIAESVLLTEAVRGKPTGATMQIKLIDEGWGSSGYYSAGVLAEAANNGVFGAGTHMYLDHPSASESVDRPERSVKDLAAVLSSPARFANGALYAEAKVLPSYRTLLAEAADAIGVSIRAAGTAEAGEADGRTGPIITSLTEGISVDFVTRAGRGGQIVALLESARTTPELPDGAPPDGDHSIIERKKEQMTDTKIDGATGGKPTDVTEAESRVKALETQLAEAREQLERRSDANVRLTEAEALSNKLREENARFRALESVRTKVASALAESGLPEASYPRVSAAVVGHEGAGIPLTESGDVDADKLKVAIESAITDMKSFVASIAEASGLGTVRGLGASAGSDELTPEQADSDLTAAFANLGMSESATRIAVNGRG